MSIQRATPVNELLAKLIFLILPTALIFYFLIWNISQYLSIIGDPNSGLFAFLPVINNLVFQLTLFSVAGMAAGAVFYSFRFRFLPTIALLALGLFFIYRGLGSIESSEFDGFFIPIQFLSFSVLFVAGWLTGWGFVRWRYWSVIMAAVLLSACIFLIAKSKTDTVLSLMQAFLPALVYAVYIIFTSEQIYSYQDKSQKFWWFLSRRLVLFTLLSVLIIGGVYFQMRGEIEETVANFGGSGKGGKNSMLEQKKDGSFDLKDYSRLQGSLGRSNELLFCAHIDNYFPGTDMPNPLYLTAFYYTKFDTLTETFERDSTIPDNDLFEPDPSKISLFFTKSDSSVIKSSLADKLRKTVEIEVYSKNLSPSTYLAPNTGFFVQPISIEKDFKEEFKSAFRAKSYVSELNSAYFIYNPQGNEELKKFQEQRFSILRKADTYDGISGKFMSYYTFMPQDEKFRRISELAGKVTVNAHTPVDKVLAIRDWFLSKDENGEPLFRYTDNPGIPDIPSASKLSYFLFENRQGYCAYYAGATLFMLRALGIPSRIAVGFLTVDRSDKNKGWYWYYADQAHAWVQVYFPGYGWIDFDTTVGNDEAQESPQPDGTPPMQPPKALLAADGVVASVDTLKKRITLNVRHMIFHDKEYSLKTPVALELDMKIASVRKDSMEIPLNSVATGDDATAVSYAEAFKKIKPSHPEGAAVIKTFPEPAPTDEVFIKSLTPETRKEKPQMQEAEEKFPWEKTLISTGIGLAVFLLLLFLLPTLIFRYFIFRYRNSGPQQKPYWAYQAAGFWLHQTGFYRNTRTPLQYASQIIDPLFGTDFTRFMNIYLKQKYAGQPLTLQEQDAAAGFLQPFLKKLRAEISRKQRVSGFLKPWRSFGYFSKETKENED